MKKLTKVSMATALVASALTPVAAFAAEGNAPAGFYNVTTGEVVTPDAFPFLSPAKKLEILMNAKNEVYYLDGSGKALAAGVLLTATTNEQVTAAQENETTVEERHNVEFTTGGKVENPTPAEGTVESIKAINAKTVEIKFNTPVDKATVISGTSLQNISITGIGVAGTDHVAPGTTTTTLSEDGKTLTVTAQAATANFFKGKYAVTVPVAVKDKEGNAVEAYSQILTVNDTVRPTVTSVTYPENNKAKITFSEPLNSVGTVTFSNSKITQDAFTVNDNSITVDLSNPALALNTDYTVTILGAKDGAGNLISPNPVNVTVQKTTVDDVKPEVASVKAVKTGVMEITFSEKLVDQGSGKIGEFVVGSLPGTPVNIDITPITGNATVDATGKVVTVSDTTNLTAGVKNVTVQNFKDLSANVGDAVTKVLDFKNDTINPKLVKSEVKADATGVEFLHLTFDEPVTAGTVTGLVATQYKDFVTTTNTMDLTGLSPVVDSNDTEYKVALNAAGVKFNGVALEKGAKYTVSLTGAFVDKAATPNPLEATTISFERAADVLTAKPKVTGVAQAADNNILEVSFDKALNGSSATNVANYSVEGLIVETATLVPGNKVELKLKADSNNISGFRNVTVSNVKSSDGVVMESHTEAVDLDENVRPIITKAQIISDEKVKLTFSENIAHATIEAANAGNDFEVYVDGTLATLTSVAQASAGTGTDDKEFILTFNNPKITDLSKPVTVKVLTGNNVKDSKGNALKTTGTITAVQ